jgi:uncharacterized protein (DUF433 family)
MEATITLSDHTYRLLSAHADKTRRPVSELVEEALEQYFLPPHPHIEKVRAVSGWRAAIKGTRFYVSIVVSYIRAGVTPEQLAEQFGPQVTLAAVYDALSYYYDFKPEIDSEIEANDKMADPQYLRERLGEERFNRITGQTK